MQFDGKGTVVSVVSNCLSRHPMLVLCRQLATVADLVDSVWCLEQLPYSHSHPFLRDIEA